MCNHIQLCFISICFRSICDSNEQHDTEIDSARVAAEEDITKNGENIIHSLGGKFSHSSLILPFLNSAQNFVPSIIRFSYSFEILADSVADK